MAREIQRADPDARRVAMRWIVAIVAVGAVIVAFSEPLIEFGTDWVTAPEGDRSQRFAVVLVVLTLATAGPVIALGWHLVRQAAAILRTERFPAPGQMLYRDSVVFRGRPATIRGRLIQLLGFGLITAAGILGYYMYSLWRLLSA